MYELTINLHTAMGIYAPPVIKFPLNAMGRHLVYQMKLLWVRPPLRPDIGTAAEVAETTIELTCSFLEDEVKAAV